MGFSFFTSVRSNRSGSGWFSPSSVMNISSHFRMMFSPPQQSLPPPSSPRPLQGRRGTRAGETCSSSAPRLNPPTRACSSPPRALTTPPPRPRRATNETHLWTTPPSKRRSPKRTESPPRRWPPSPSTASGLSPGCSPPAEGPNLPPHPLHHRHHHPSQLRPLLPLCPLNPCPCLKPPRPRLLDPNSSL